MKKYIYIAGICMSALLATSCEDFLTVSSPDKLTSDSFWRDEADAEAGMAAAYSQLEYYIDTWEFAEVKWPVEAYREDIIDIGNDAMNYQNWVELYNFSYTNGNSQFNSYWSNNYRGISFANQVMEKVAGIENMDATKLSQMVCEAQFLRAYYHLKLLLNWKEIVIRDKYITDPAELDKALSSRTECWDFIVDDLKNAAAGLPSSYDSDNLGRATSGAAYSYLGFAYLTRAYEEPEKKTEYLNNALSAFGNVRGYELETDFGSMFDGTNKNCKESIFELQTSMSSANGANYRTQLQYWIATAELGGWDEILPNKILVDEYKKEGQVATTGLYDTRFYHTLFTDCDYYNDGTGKVFGYDYNELFDTDRPAFRKLLPATADAFWEDYCAINVPLMRYANVLLMMAEAHNELGNPANAIPLINQVRAAHGNMPAMTGISQNEVQAQIEHERMLEFPLENWRWYDLRRWGKLSQALNAVNRTSFSQEKSAFFPTPLTEINSNALISE